MAFGGPAEVLELVQAKRPILAVDEDEIEIDLPQNVDHPWGGEGKVVAVSFASGTHGGFDSVGLLHRMSSSVRRLRPDRPTLSVFARCWRPNSAPGKASPPRSDAKRRMGNSLDARRKRSFARARSNWRGSRLFGGGREGLEWPSSDNRGSLIAAHSGETRPVCRTAKFGPVRACTPSKELRSAGWRLVRQPFRVG